MNMINSNNSDNLTAGNRNSTNMIFTKTDGNGLIDSENLSITQSDQVSESPIYTNYSNQDIKTSKASCEIPADECWLFKPPKLHQTQGSVEPINKWLRAIFDSPDSRFYHSRRNLLSRLEAIILAGGQTEAYHFGGSVPSLHLINSGYPPVSHRGGAELSAYGSSISNRMVTASSSDSLSFPNQPLSENTTINNELINVGTFTRSHKPRISLPPQCSTSKSMRNGPHNSNSYLSNSTGANFSFKSPNKTGSCDELEITSTNTNVQEIARRQEDALKAEVAALAAAAAGRHGSQHSLASLCRNSPHGSYTNIASAPESPHSSSTKLNQPHSNYENFYAKQSLSVSQEFEGHVTNPSQQLTQNVQPSCFSSDTPPRKDSLLNLTTHASSVSNIKQNPYKILPQKPMLANIVSASGDDSKYSKKISGISSYPPVNSFSIPAVTNVHNPVVEARTHFGFRSSRKITTIPSAISSNPGLLRTSEDQLLPPGNK
ncbi:unnamed protein product [Heterobilharzia americana]|nr:unnamed protein product [Heterobilharzia americana]